MMKLPKIGDKYFFVDAFGDTPSATWMASASDMYAFKTGNCFATIEEAVRARDSRDAAGPMFTPE